MAFRLPNGSTLELAATYDAPEIIVSITNANPAVVTSTAHGYANGDYVEITSGWLRLSGRVLRVANVTTDTYELEGVNTTNTTTYPVGGSAGTSREILTWQQIPQITGLTTSGGEQQFFTFGFLEENDDRQLPTTRSPLTLTMTVADDPAQPFFAVAQAADEARSINALRLNLAGGSKILYNGYPTITQTPTLTRNELMTLTMTYSIAAAPVRYLT